MKRALTLLIFFALVNFIPLISLAVEKTADTVDVSIDFTPPDLTAFSLLGVSTNRVARPANVKELAVSMSDAVGEGGEIAPNIALEWAPGQTFAAKDLMSYKKSKLWRRLTFTFGSVKDSLGTSLAFGFRWVPIDKSDPLFSGKLEAMLEPTLHLWDSLGLTEYIQYDFANDSVTGFIKDSILPMAAENIRVNLLMSLINIMHPDITNPAHILPTPVTEEAALNRIIDTLKDYNIEYNQLPGGIKDRLEFLSSEYVLLAKGLMIHNDDGGNKSIDDLVGDEVIRIKEQFKKESWNAAVIHLASGIVGFSPDSKWKGLKTKLWRSYLAASWPVTKYGQIIGQVDADYYRMDNSDDEWGQSYGLRFLFGSSDIHASLEGLYEKPAKGVGASDEEIWRYTFGGEIKLSKALWLELGLANESQKGNDAANEIITLANLKYGLTKATKLKIPPE